jgi:hypothetical protein
VTPPPEFAGIPRRALDPRPGALAHRSAALKAALDPAFTGA